jgi:PAS domain S-box-containing protein
VSVTRERGRLDVRVRDDGTGFTPDAGTGFTPDAGTGFTSDAPPSARERVRSQRGVGVATMRERAMLLQGDLAIESTPGRGTTVRLVVPLAGADTFPAGAPAARTDPAATDAPPAAAVDDEPRTALAAATPPIAAVADTLPIASRAPSSDPQVVPRPLPEALDREVFRRMADMASEAFMLVDHDARYIYVNDRACTLSGFTRGELLAMSIPDLNPDFPLDVWRTWAATATGAVTPFETRHVCKDGTVIPVEVSAARIERPGEPYFFGVIRDIRDRKEAEAAQHGFTRRLLHTLEAERRRVARELHDEVGQVIAAVGVLLHTLEQTPGSIPRTLDRELAATYGTIGQITESIARIVRDYHPADLVALGLEETLRTHAQQFAQRHRLRLRLATISTNGVLSDECALHVYRIVQEALANVARHARARHVSVSLARRGHRLVVTVRDDGIGFDSASTRAGSLGLVTMRERAALIEGTLDVRASRGKGTEVRLVVPTSDTSGRGAR